LVIYAIFTSAGRQPGHRNNLNARLSLVQQELAAAKAWAWLAYIFPVAGQ